MLGSGRDTAGGMLSITVSPSLPLSLPPPPLAPGRQMNDRHVYLHSNADDDDMDDDEIQSRILIAFVSSPALQCLGLQCLVVSGLQSLVSSLRL